MNRIYLDYAATTPMAESVLQAMLPYFREYFGNASSIYHEGREAKKHIGQARDRIQNAIGADRPDEIIFTSGGTESNNMALRGVMQAGKKKHIITSQIEHPAVLHTCEFLESVGYHVTYLMPNTEGLIDPQLVENAINDDTQLISIMTANNEIGTIQPIEAIGMIAHKRGVLFHTDAVQAFGAMPIDVNQYHIDLLSITAHKLYGPQGVGALYIRRGTRMDPILYGGAQEKKRRPGTENLAGIIGFGVAVEKALMEQTQEQMRLLQLRNYFMDSVLALMPNARVNGSRENRLANNANFLFSDIDGEALLFRLDMAGVSASSGSACSSGAMEASHVLQAIGRTYEEAQSSIRFSLGRKTTREELQKTTEILKQFMMEMKQ